MSSQGVRTEDTAYSKRHCVRQAAGICCCIGSIARFMQQQHANLSIGKSHACRCAQVRQCRRDEVAQYIGAAHMVVPLMARLDADMLAKAHNLRVILQYGVGVEGVDIPAVRSPPFPSSSWVHPRKRSSPISHITVHCSWVYVSCHTSQVCGAVIVKKAMGLTSS